MSSRFYDIHSQTETWISPAGDKKVVAKAALCGLSDKTQKPHFSLTGTIYEKNSYGILEAMCFGCCHDEISKAFNGRFKLIEDLHLSDEDGEPMHSVANGLYWYKCGFNWKAVPGGFCKAHDPYKYGTDLVKGSDNHLRVLSHHLRITTKQAKDLIDKQLSDADFTDYVASQRQRWKLEAQHVLGLLQGKFF